MRVFGPPGRRDAGAPRQFTDERDREGSPPGLRGRFNPHPTSPFQGGGEKTARPASLFGHRERSPTEPLTPPPSQGRGVKTDSQLRLPWCPLDAVLFRGEGRHRLIRGTGRFHLSVRMSGPAARATTRSPMPVPRCLASRTDCGGKDTHLLRTAAHILETRWCLCGAWANSTPCIRKEYPRHPVEIAGIKWLRGQDSNLRPSGYEPDELPDCSTPRHRWTTRIVKGICARRGGPRAWKTWRRPTLPRLETQYHRR